MSIPQERLVTAPPRVRVAWAPAAAWGLVVLGATSAWLAHRARGFEELARREREIATSDRRDREARLVEFEGLARRLGTEVEALRERLRDAERARQASAAAREAWSRSGAGDVATARRALSAVSERHPDSVEAARFLGRFELRLGRRQAAAAALERALAIDPADRLSRLLAYEALAESGRADEAATTAGWLATGSDGPGAGLGQALAAIAPLVAGRPADEARSRQAESILGRTALGTPADPWPRYWLGRLRAATGRPGEALGDFEAASALDRDEESFHAWRGRMAWELGDPVLALVACSAALDRCPRYLQALEGAARAERRLDRSSEALGHLDRWIELDPEAALPLVDRGELRLALGRPDLAESDLLRALELDPRATRAHFALGLVHLEAGAFELAADEFARTIELEPDRADAHHRRAQALAALGRALHALDHLDRAAELSPGDPEVLVLRGRIHQELGHPADAIADYERALRLGASGWRLAAALGAALLAAGRKSAARLHWRRAVEIAPEEDAERVREKIRALGE